MQLIVVLVQNYTFTFDHCRLKSVQSFWCILSNSSQHFPCAGFGWNNEAAVDQAVTLSSSRLLTTKQSPSSTFLWCNAGFREWFSFALVQQLTSPVVVKSSFFHHTSQYIPGKNRCCCAKEGTNTFRDGEILIFGNSCSTHSSNFLLF